MSLNLNHARGGSMAEEAWTWAKGNKGKVAIIAGVVAIPILMNVSKNFFVFSNPMVEAGYVGYVYKEPVKLSRTEGGFYRTINGPGRLGLRFLAKRIQGHPH